MTDDKNAEHVPTLKRRKMIGNLPLGSDYRTRIDSSGGPSVCWPWIGPVDRYGYGVISRLGRAHRIAREEFNGCKLDKDQVVRHSCDKPACCNPEHLEIGTQDDNVRDRVDRGRSARGELNGRAKLDAKTAQAIFNNPGKVTHLAKEFGLDESTVRGIKSGKTWAWATSHIPKK
jgi:hypothetical protein